MRELYEDFKAGLWLGWNYGTKRGMEIAEILAELEREVDSK